MARPDFNIKAIPVGPILSKLLNGIIADVPFSEIYENSTPHGRPSLYFLAGLISYMAIFEEIPNSTYHPGPLVNPIIIEKMEEIKSEIWTSLSNFNFQDSRSRVFLNSSTSNSHNQIIRKPITVFPNPATNNLIIKSELSDHQILLFNSIGQIVKRKVISNHKSVITLSDLSGGIYILILLDEHGEMKDSQLIMKL